MDKFLFGVLVMLLVVVFRNPTSNPIANMYGFHFLLFYGFLITVTLLVSLWSVRRDSTANLPLPLVPSNPDPYEIAYLRGGENEVTRLVIFDLVQDGYLQINQDRIERSLNFPDPIHLFTIEREVFNWFSSPRSVEEVFQSSLPVNVKKHCTVYEQHLLNDQLLFPKTAKEIANRVAKTGMFIILGLGGYKLLIALLKGHFNVMLLIVMGIISSIILAIISQPPRLSQRGQAYLKRLQQTFERFKTQVFPSTPDGTEFNILLPLALFGIDTLPGTPYAEFRNFFHRSATSENAGINGGDSSCGGGSSCGGSSDGGSSSCSSGSDSSSSCGGGCGGCGGG